MENMISEGEKCLLCSTSTYWHILWPANWRIYKTIDRFNKIELPKFALLFKSASQTGEKKNIFALDNVCYSLYATILFAQQEHICSFREYEICWNTRYITGFITRWQKENRRGTSNRYTDHGTSIQSQTHFSQSK